MVSKRKIDETAKFFIAKGSGGNVNLPAAHPEGKNPGDVILARPDIYGEDEGNRGRVRGHLNASRYDGTDKHPLGRNPGDYWSINTKPFPEAHFAVFPERLCEVPIKAGCPEYVCKKCGKPRERVTQQCELTFDELDDNTKQAVIRAGTTDGTYYGQEIKDYERHKAQKPSETKRRILKSMMSTKDTVAWSDCGCNAGWSNGIVLDPLCGSGTVGVVARKLLRNYILIDLSPEYVKLAKKRLAKIPARIEKFDKDNDVQ